MSGVKGRSGGRNAKTQRELALAGTKRRDRHSGYRNPEPPGGIPRPPVKLDGLGREEWDRLCTRLSDSRTLSTVDDAAMYQYCRLFAETEEIAALQIALAATIEMVETSMHELEGKLRVECIQEVTRLRGLQAANSARIRQGRLAVRAYLVEFGLTPASRGRVRVPEGSKPEDPFSGFDGGGSGSIQ